MARLTEFHRQHRRLLGSAPSDGTAATTGAGPSHLRAAAVCSPWCRYFQWTLFSTNAHNYCMFVVILYSNRTGRPPLFPTVGPRQPETTTLTALIFPLGGFRPLTLQFAADLVHSTYVPVCFRRDHRGPAGLGSDGLGDILATLDAPQ
jgi:hypothetical protein